MWDGMLAWLIDNDAQDDLDQPEWSDAVYRKTHQEHIFDVLSAFIAKWPKEEFAVSAQSRKLPWAAVDRPEELLRNPQLNDRDFFTDVTGDHGTYRDLGFGFAFPEGRRIGTLEAARLGQHQELLKATSPVAVNETHEFSGGSTPSLEGVRVLDLTWVLAGPYGTRILADHGADVIKVESIGRPDPTRFAPFMHLSRGPHDNPNTSGYFNDVNRNKRSITLDTRSAEGLSVLRDLIRNSDVVVENFSSSVMDKMGLGYEQLRELNPDIIYVSMSGMGHTGPRKDWVSYADIVSASTGLTALTGWNADDVVGVIYGHGDIVAGLQAGVAMLAALDYRDRTGRGQHVDLSQLEAMAAHMVPAFSEPPGHSPPIRSATAITNWHHTACTRASAATGGARLPFAIPRNGMHCAASSKQRNGSAILTSRVQKAAKPITNVSTTPSPTGPGLCHPKPSWNACNRRVSRPAPSRTDATWSRAIHIFGHAVSIRHRNIPSPEHSSTKASPFAGTPNPARSDALRRCWARTPTTSSSRCSDTATN